MACSELAVRVATASSAIVTRCAIVGIYVRCVRIPWEDFMSSGILYSTGEGAGLLRFGGRLRRVVTLTRATFLRATSPESGRGGEKSVFFTSPPVSGKVERRASFLPLPVSGEVARMQLARVRV